MRLDLPAAARRMIRLAFYAAGALVAARLPVPVVGRLQRCGKPRPLGRHRMAADLRDAQLGQDACLGIEAPPLDHPDLVTLGAGAFPRRLRLLPRRAGRADQPDRATACCRRRPISRRRCGRGATASCSGSSSTASSTPACRHGSAQQRDDEVWAVVAFLQAAARARCATAIATSRSAACRSRRRADASSRPPRPTSEPSAPARAATARSAAARRARWCRCCTASPPNF